MKTIGIVKETNSLETRVALVPEVVADLIKHWQVSVFVEEGAGVKAGYLDQDYQAAGALIEKRHDVVSRSHIVVGIAGVDILNEQDLANKTIIGLFEPVFHKDTIKRSCALGTSLLSLELIPRISRAQSMDVLSSQANIAGYVAVLVALSRLKKVMPLMMTAGGTIKPAKVLVLGAGVAGLQAIATAKRLGAIVFAYDVRPVVKEQVESLGAKFVEIKMEESGEGGGGYAKALSESSQSEQREKLAVFAKDMDVVITTALIPGQKAPLLLDERVYTFMKKDSVIIDMASKSGGNVSGSVTNEWVEKNGILIYGADNLARVVAKDASFTFSKNIRSLLDLLLAHEELSLDDDILRDAFICHKKTYVNSAMAKYMASDEQGNV